MIVNTEGFQIIDDDDTASNIELRFGDSLDERLRWDRTASQFQLTDDLEILGTGSGENLFATKSITGAYLHASATFGGAGLTDCDTGASSKLLWSAESKIFSCGADQTGAGGSPAGSDLHVQYNDGGSTFGGEAQFRYNKTTDTLNVTGTSSGRVIHAQDQLRSSGSLIIEGAAGFQDALTFGDAIGDAITANAGTWTFVNDTNVVLSGGVNGLSFDTNTLSIDATSNRVGIGTIAPDVALDVVGTVSGSLVQGTAVNALQTLEGANLTDCDTANTSKLLWDATTKKFSCGTDQTGAGGGMSLTRINGNSGAAGADVTWQNLTANSATCNTTALCASVMTTTTVGAGTWKFKYTLIYQTAATTTGIGFGINHTGTVGEFQAMWYHPTTGGAAATGIGDNDTATSAGQLMEAKHDNGLNAVIGSATAGVATANADILAILEGIIVVTGSGNMELKLASEVASSNVLIKADSSLELMKIE
jgi:hypothetical protein